MLCLLKGLWHPRQDMHRRQYLQAVGALAGSVTLAGCGSFGGTNSDVDPRKVAATARDRMAATSYDFEWRTEGDRLGTDFFQVIHDREDEHLLLRNREGGAYFVDFYASGEAYRNTAPDSPGVENRFDTPDNSPFFFETLLASIQRTVRVWISGYEYDSPKEREEGTRFDIVGGGSQIPYRLNDPKGHLLVSEDGVIQDLQVAGVPVNDSGEGEPTPLDSHIEMWITLETNGIEVTEPDWVAMARQSL